MSPTGSLSAAARRFRGTVIVLTALVLLAGGWVVPFRFESFSILYKFGLEKLYLRSGKVIGITAAILVLYQLLLACRFGVMERIFTARRLLWLHRVNGMAVALLVICHPLLIKASENFTSYTFEEKYYPEFVGIGLLVILLLFSFAAIFRNVLQLSYKVWLLQHRLGATLIVLVMPAHILFVSETFKTGLPRSAAVIIFTLNLLLISRIWLRRLRRR